jgi:hypothetical protein
MIEEEGREIESQENIIKLNVGRHSIETLKLIPRTR